MEWPKLKNIILLILLVANLFLLALMGVRSWSAAQYESAARTDALEILFRNGINMEEDTLSKDMVLSTASVSRDRGSEAQLLTALLGPVKEETLGGGQVIYTGELGQAQLRSRGEFSIELQPGAYLLSGDPEEHAAKILEKLSFEGALLSSTGCTEDSQVTFVQLWEGRPVISCQVTVVYDGIDLISISGTRLMGTPAISSQAEYSAVNGVLRFLEQIMAAGDVCSQITHMQAGYELSTGPSDPASLIPVWHFSTNTGSYTLNAVTYQLRRLQ